MSALFELDDFEETRVEWEPIYQLSIASFGWHWAEGKSLPQHADETPITKAEWGQYLASRRCRDCGVKGDHTRGGSDHGGWSLCRECSVLADVSAPWGGPQYNSTDMSPGELEVRQERRRTDYRREIAC